MKPIARIAAVAAIPGPARDRSSAGARARGNGLAIACIAAFAFLGGCTAMNPFVANYRGERLAAVPSASIVAAPPAETAARQIGTSRFLLSTPHQEDGAAVAAACEVGADQVMLGCRSLGTEEWMETDPVYERRASGRGQFASYIPIPGSRERWECTATFWRSLSADRVQDPGSVPSSATPPSLRPSPGP